MNTHVYFIPNNALGRNIINVIIQKVECSIGDLKINRQTDTIRFPITCKDSDVNTINRILKRFDLM